MAGNIGASAFVVGLKNAIFRSSVTRAKFPIMTGTSSHQPIPQKRHLFTTSPSLIKEISMTEENNKIVIEGKYIPSPREKFLAKLDRNPSGCEECPLCKLGLTVRHTDVLVINQFINSKGKQLPQEVTGLCNDQHKRMNYLIVMAEKAGLIDRDVERTVVHNNVVLYTPEEWEDTHYHKYYDEEVIEEFLYSRRHRHI